MTEFKIEKDVPLPSKGKGVHGRYPWKEMEIGDSIFVPCVDGDSQNAIINRMGGSLQMVLPRKFMRRRTNENGVLGIRVWRIA